MNLKPLRQMASDAKSIYDAGTLTGEFGPYETLNSVTQALTRALDALDVATKQRDFYIIELLKEDLSIKARDWEDKELERILFPINESGDAEGDQG